MIQPRKPVPCKRRLRRAVTKTAIESLEDRRLLSATIATGSSLLVFNAVQNSSASVVETLTVTDSGTTSLTLGSSAFALTNDPTATTQDAAKFTLVNATSAPATLAPGASFGLKLSYTAKSVVTNSAILKITTNDTATPIASVTLHGIGTKGVGGTNQPSLATILRAYDIPTIVGEGADDANAATDSTYPNPPDASSQEVNLQRLVKAGSGPVTINVLASFVASGFPKSYVLGTYTPGNPSSLDQLFYDTAGQNQTTYVQPQGSTSFDPGTTPFGFYFVTNVQVAGRVGYSEDALNTWDTTNARKFRFFPMEKPDGTIVPDTFVMTTTEWDAPVGYDFTNIVAIVSNVKAATGAPTGPVMGLQDLNAVPGSSTMVFNRIQTPNATLGDLVHDTGTLRINNTGSQTLKISSYSFSSSAWTLVSPPTFPLTVAAGAHLDLSIKFVATTEPSVPYNETNGTTVTNGGGVYNGTLTLISNDPNNASSTVALAGWFQAKSENSSEPSLQTITNLLFGWGTNINSSPIADLTESTSTSSSPTYYGEEVVSPYWAEADPDQSVTVQQIDAFHTQGNSAVLYWTTQNGSSTQLIANATDAGQTLFPYAINTSTPSAATFSSTGSFGFRVDAEYSDESKNTITTGGAHHIRFFPLRTAAGAIVPNTYLMGLDYSAEGENFDFQDTLFVIGNIRPVTVKTGLGTTQTTAAPSTPVDFNATSTGNVNTLQWAPVADTSIGGYDVYRSATATGAFALLNSTPITTTSFTDTTAPASGTSYYRLTAISSALSGQSLAVSASTTNTAAVTGTGAPVAAPESATTAAATAVTIDVFADATDNSIGKPIASSVALASAPSNGTVGISSVTGAITYTPAAGFSGTDTFTYTIGDDTGATSAPATITVTVMPGGTPTTGTPVAANLSETTTFNSPVTFTVADSATDSAATIVATSVVITTAPAHGNATVDPTTGAIIFTPASGFVGSDTLQYTVADSAGQVSSPAVVTFNVGATVDGITAKTLVFTDAANSRVTISLTGPGSTQVFFNGTGTETVTGPKGRQTVTVSGSGLSTSSITVAGTTAASSLVIIRRGAATVPVSDITITNAIGRIVAPTSALTGALSIAGAASSIQFGSITNGAITIGSTGAKPGGSTFIATAVSDSTLTSAVPVRSLKVTSWSAGSVTAPGISSLTAAGAFTPSLTDNGLLGITRIGGQIAGSWAVAGAATNLVFGSIAAGWTGNFAQAVNSFTSRSGGFAGTLSAGTINSITLTGTDSGSITAESIRSAKIVGSLTNAAITVTNGVNPKLQSLGRLTITGATGDSQITSAGNIGAIASSGFSGTNIEAGITSGITLPANPADFGTTATVGSVTVTGRGSLFSDTNIAAETIGSLNLGTVQTGNADTPFGVAAGTINAVAAAFSSGGKIHLTRRDLTSVTTVDDYLSAHDLTAGDFVIRPGI